MIHIDKEKFMFFKFHKNLTLVFTSTALLFCSYQFGVFSIADSIAMEGAFQRYGYDSDALVIGKIVQSRRQGILDSQGRLGRFHDIPNNEVGENISQTMLLNGELSGGRYKPYSSHFGLQGIIYSIVDNALTEINIDSKNRVFIYQSMASLFLAVLLSIVVLLFYLELGIYPAIFLLFGLAGEQFLILIAKSLYWSFWTLYLPFFIAFVVHKLDEKYKNINFNYFYLSIFTAIFFKSLIGYEFISTVILATFSPIVYFSIKNQWEKIYIIKRLIITGLCGVLGFISALILHIVQLYFSTGSVYEAWNMILFRIMVRTHGNPNDYSDTGFADHLSSSLFDVYFIYLKGIKGATAILIAIYILVTVISCMRLQALQNNYHTIKALVITLWFSFLAPMSWHTLAKGHSYDHTRLNHVLWNLPFNIFGFALVGFVLYLLIQDFRKKKLKINA